jgi:hypothetical protein
MILSSFQYPAQEILLGIELDSFIPCDDHSCASLGSFLLSIVIYGRTVFLTISGRMNHGWESGGMIMKHCKILVIGLSLMICECASLLLTMLIAGNACFHDQS